MWKKIVVAGAAGAALLGGGAAALAAESSPSQPTTPPTAGTPAAGTPSTGTPSTGKAHHRGLVAAKRFEHGEWVSRDGGKNVTHDAIKGTVTAISPSSVSVKAADGTSMTFTVDSNTKIVLRESGKGSAKKGSATDVKVNDHVLVAGTKSGSVLSAKHLLDTGSK